jgi:D-glycero-D-manno-heptose 1,7-bisphosphate phosphatase
VKLVILDRDGTINHDSDHYIKSLDEWRPIDGSLEAIARLTQAGFRIVVATNQSGIARGLVDETAYRAITVRLDELLAASGARLDAHYHCPHHPDFTGPCRCRKPGPLLFERAAADHGLDLARCWWVGDRLRDVQPAAGFGGRGLLIGAPSGEGAADGGRHATVRDLPSAVDIILG